MSENEGLQIAEDEVREGEEGCPICLNDFHGQELGLPESCDHIFCLICIQEWSKTNNSCPIDRSEFRLILTKNAVDGPIVLRIPIEKVKDVEANFPVSEEEEEEATYCEVCGQRDREDRMLLCDACDCGYHLECLTPPLEEVPHEEWFCPECRPEREIEIIEQPRQRARRRIIPRTEAAERVRMRIAQRLEESDSSTDDEEIEDELPPQSPERDVEPEPERPSTSAIPKIKKTPAKRKSRKRRVVRKRKRRGRKRAASSSKQGRDKSRTKLAGQLAISPPGKGHFLPKVGKSKSASFWGSSASSSVPTPLSLFGHPNECISFEDDEDEEDDQLLTRNARNFDQRIALRPRGSSAAKRSATAGLGTNKENSESSLRRDTSHATGADILGSIFEGQDVLHAPSKHIAIEKDGSLKAKESLQFHKEKMNSRTSNSDETLGAVDDHVQGSATNDSTPCLPDSSDEVPEAQNESKTGDDMKERDDESPGGSCRAQVVSSTVTDEVKCGQEESETHGTPMDIVEDEDDIPQQPEAVSSAEPIVPVAEAVHKHLFETLKPPRPPLSSPIIRPRKGLLPIPHIEKRKSLMGDPPAALLKSGSLDKGSAGPTIQRSFDLPNQRQVGIPEQQQHGLPLPPIPPQSMGPRFLLQTPQMPAKCENVSALQNQGPTPAPSKITRNFGGILPDPVPSATLSANPFSGPPMQMTPQTISNPHHLQTSHGLTPQQQKPPRSVPSYMQPPSMPSLSVSQSGGPSGGNLIVQPSSVTSPGSQTNSINASTANFLPNTGAQNALAFPSLNHHVLGQNLSQQPTGGLTQAQLLELLAPIQTPGIAQQRMPGLGPFIGVQGPNNQPPQSNSSLLQQPMSGQPSLMMTLEQALLGLQPGLGPQSTQPQQQHQLLGGIPGLDSLLLPQIQQASQEAAALELLRQQQKQQEQQQMVQQQQAAQHQQQQALQQQQQAIQQQQQAIQQQQQQALQQQQQQAAQQQLQEAQQQQMHSQSHVVQQSLQPDANTLSEFGLNIMNILQPPKPPPQAPVLPPQSMPPPAMPPPNFNPADIPLPPCPSEQTRSKPLQRRRSREQVEEDRVRRIQEEEMSLRNSIFGRPNDRTPRKDQQFQSPREHRKPSTACASSVSNPPMNPHSHSGEDPNLPPELANLVQHFTELKKRQAQEASNVGFSSSVPPPVQPPRPPESDNAGSKRQKLRFSDQTANNPPRTAQIQPSTSRSRKLAKHERYKVNRPPNAALDDSFGSNDSDLKMSKAEKKQKKKEIKLKKLLAEATSTTEDDEVTGTGFKKEKLLNKFNYQMRVEEEVKLALRPHYSKKAITKEEYKEIMKKCVPKICKKKGQIKPAKIKSFVEVYVQKISSDRKKQQ